MTPSRWHAVLSPTLPRVPSALRDLRVSGEMHQDVNAAVLKPFILNVEFDQEPDLASVLIVAGIIEPFVGGSERTRTQTRSYDDAAEGMEWPFIQGSTMATYVPLTPFPNFFVNGSTTLRASVE